MKRIFAILSFLLPVLLFAAERSATEAAALAAQFMNEQYAMAPSRKASCSATSFILTHTRAKLGSEAPAFYVFNKSNQDGYVVISGDDRTEDVLMYSEEGSLDVETANPNLKFWLNHLQEEISAANDDNTYTAAEKKVRKATAVTAISPLLGSIAWDQAAPYYNQCPYSSYDSKAPCLTGCVATAAAQIMRKWKYPEKGTGSMSYTWYDYKDDNYEKWKTSTLTKDFSKVTFDWDNMLETYGKSYTTAQATAVATLMYCCGVACEMCYGTENTTGGSGSWTDDMGYGLKQFFGYKVGKMISNYASQNAYEEDKYAKMKDIPAQWGVEPSDFGSYFDEDLEAGRPILMGGYGKSSGGHEFVCDGRDATGKYHINWGWSGDSNNYCAITALKPSGTNYNFSSSVDALLGLEPATVDSVHVTGVTVTPTSLTLKQKEKSTLSATVAPNNATDKTVTWSSSDSKIATVSATGVVQGVAAGNATITVTTKDGNKRAVCNITVSNEIIETNDCEAYQYEFTKVCTTGSNKLGTYTWNIVLQAGSINTSMDQYNRGVQFGSSNTPAKQVSLTTANVAECLVNEIRIIAAMGNGGNGKLAVYIDGQQIGLTENLTSTSVEYTFENTAEIQGNLEIRYTNSSKALFIKSINVNPSDEPTLLEEQNAAKTGLSASKFLIDGKLYIQMGEQLFDAQGQLVH